MYLTLLASMAYDAYKNVISAQYCFSKQRIPDQVWTTWPSLPSQYVCLDNPARFLRDNNLLFLPSFLSEKTKNKNKNAALYRL